MLPAWLRRLFGSRSEKAAARYLRQQGFRILTRNYTCSLGELDLVALEELRAWLEASDRLVRARANHLDRPVFDRPFDLLAGALAVVALEKRVEALTVAFGRDGVADHELIRKKRVGDLHF